MVSLGLCVIPGVLFDILSEWIFYYSRCDMPVEKDLYLKDLHESFRTLIAILHQEKFYVQ